MADKINIYDKDENLNFDMIVPVNDDVLVVPEQLTKTDSGIILGREQMKKWCKVVAIGPNVKDVKIGDTVCFTPRGVRPMKYGKSFFFRMAEESVLAKLED